MTNKNMEEALNLINRKYVSLDNDRVKYTNERLKSTLQDLISILKTQDTLFDKLYERPYFGGSYYDDLKVGKPDEFDLDLLLVLPKVCETHKIKNCGCVTVTPSNKPGFFWFKVKQGYCAEMDKFIKDGYIQTDLILNWLKSKVTGALDKLKSLDSSITYSPTYYSESGPALTLQVNSSFGEIYVDIVPAFKFGSERWPNAGYRSNKTTRPEFFLVPKKPKGMLHGERYWRPSFQDQEREIIKGKERLKPALRLLKKMRNNLTQSSISSYALKTIVLLEMDTSYFDWNETLSSTFMKLLNKYKESLDNERISYYWNKKNNLLDGIKSITLENHHNEICRLLKLINDQYETNPCIVAKVILKEGTQEYNEFIAEFRRSESIASNINRMSIRSSSEDSLYPSPTVITNPPSNLVRARNAAASGRSSSNSQTTTQQTMENSSSGWTTAGVMLGIGAVAVVGLRILGALNSNNRNQNR